MPPTEPGPPLRVRIGGFLVHVLTASGVALGLMALLAAHEQRWAEVFLWLGVALAVDAIDGPLARKFRVGERLPRWSGETLDLVVDYLNYVFIPTFALVASGMLPTPLAIAAGAAILITSALYFADRGMKTEDDYFRGFPAVWNIVVFYIFLFRPEPIIIAVTIALFCIMTFVPVVFIHPFRVRKFRLLNGAILTAWTILAAVTLRYDFTPPFPVAIAILVLGFYFLAAGLLRNLSK